MVGALHRPYDEPTAPWPESTVAVPRDDLIDVLVHDWDHIDVSDDGRTLDIYYRAGVPECWALDSVKVATAEWGHRVEVHMGRIPGGTDCTEDEHPWVTTVELDESLDERWESATSDD